MKLQTFYRRGVRPQKMCVLNAQISGTQNTEADSLFQKISCIFKNPTLDLIASLINHYMSLYITIKY